MSIRSAPSSLIRPLLLRRSFHAAAPRYVKVGDAIPAAPLMEDSPGNKVDLAKEIGTRQAVIVGVPAAFSPSCSNSHIPEYIQHARQSSKGPIYVVSVNDAFVMKAWAASLDPERKSGVRFLADPSGAFARELDLLFDGQAIFGGERAKRFALVVEGGKVTETYVEPDGTGVDVSRASKVIG